VRLQKKLFALLQEFFEAAGVICGQCSGALNTNAAPHRATDYLDAIAAAVLAMPAVLAVLSKPEELARSKCLQERGGSGWGLGV